MCDKRILTRWWLRRALELMLERSGCDRRKTQQRPDNSDSSANTFHVATFCGSVPRRDSVVLEEEFRRGRQKRRRFGIGLVISIVVLLILGTIVYPPFTSSPLDEPPLPNPNGFDDLVRAGHAIVGQIPGPKGDYQNAGADELRKWVEANHEALTIARPVWTANAGLLYHPLRINSKNT